MAVDARTEINRPVPRFAATEPSTEIDRIALHLRRVHARLSRAVASGSHHRERVRGLTVLERYLRARNFPRNRGGEAPARRLSIPRSFPLYPGNSPVFVDEEGCACAVAAMMLGSGAETLAARIRRSANRAWLAEMATPGLSAWVAQSGFNLEELAMIQPTYGGSITLRSGDLVCSFEADDHELGGVLGAPMTRADLEKFIAHSDACAQLAGGDVHGDLKVVPSIRQLSGSPALTTEAALASLQAHFERRAEQGRIFLREGGFLVESGVVPSEPLVLSSGRGPDGATGASEPAHEIARSIVAISSSPVVAPEVLYPMAGLAGGALVVAILAVRHIRRVKGDF